MIKENEPTLTPLHVSSDQPPVERVIMIDQMADGLAVLPNRGLESTTIVPVTECEEWVEEIRLVHSWFEKGYINQDAATSTVSFESAFRAGDNFGAMMIWHPTSPKAFGGQEMVYAMLGDHVEVGCNSVLNPGTVIGRNTNVYPLSRVRGVIPADSIFKNEKEIVKKQ